MSGIFKSDALMYRSESLHIGILSQIPGDWSNGLEPGVIMLYNLRRSRVHWSSLKITCINLLNLCHERLITVFYGDLGSSWPFQNHISNI